jgi:hypothetical protein
VIEIYVIAKRGENVRDYKKKNESEKTKYEIT